MNNQFDLSKEYGLVLEGGGAKGAYQIGVWKALLEMGVKIKGVAGVSVGALNGALICMGDYEGAEKLWSDITYSSIMKVNDDTMNKLVSGNFKDLDIKEVAKDTVKTLSDGGIDITPLKELINTWVDEDKIQNSEIEFMMGTVLASKLKEVEISAKEVDKGYLKDYLLASSYLPAFRNEKLNGTRYLDGGMLNNVPINMLLNRSYKDIIVIRIYGIGHEKQVKIPEDVTIIEIAPRVNLGGILEFDCTKSRRNIKIGFYDGLRCLHSLKGKIYYIDSELTDGEYLNKLVQVNDVAKIPLFEFYRIDYMKDKSYARKFIEQVCPRLATTLKLNKDWSYEDLYISLLELCAKSLKIQKYNVYTIEELRLLIIDKYKILSLKGNKFPLFYEIILNMVTY